MSYVGLKTPAQGNSSSLAVAPDIEREAVDVDLLNDETFGSLTVDPVNLKHQDGGIAIDDHNDDTFGGGALTDDWEESHEKFSKIIEGQHTRSIDGSREDGSGSSEEEEEIINNTISQLGLDDDQDEPREESPAVHSTVPDLGSNWEKIPKESSNLDSPLSSLLLPDRGIWASPDRGMFGKNSDGETQKLSLGVMQGPLVDRVDMRKVPLPPPPGMEPLPNKMDIRTVDEIEQELKSTPQERPQVVPNYTENHIPSPGGAFATTFNQNLHYPIVPNQTPLHQGGPLRPPPGMVPPQRMMHPLTPMPPFRGAIGNSPLMPPGRMPSSFSSPQFPPTPDPLHLYSLAIAGNRFQGDPASLLNMPPMIDNRTGLPIIPHPFFNMPQHTPRPSHTLYQDRRQGGNNNRYQRHDNQDENRWIKLPPSDLMTSKEKEWIVKIQLMQLLSCDPFVSDYYYISHMNSKLQKVKAEKEDAAKTAQRADDDQDADFKQTKKMLGIIQQNQEERFYKPAGFEGSLGKLSVTSVHHPRQIFDVKHASHDHEENISPKKVVDPSKKRFAFFSDVEKSYDLLININDIDRKLVHVSDEMREKMLTERAQKVSSILALLRVPHKEDANQNVKDYDDFSIMMSITKSRKLLGTFFTVASQRQSEWVIEALANCLGSILKRELTDEALPTIVKSLTVIVKRSSTMFVAKLCEIIKTQNMTTVLSCSFGILFLNVVLERFSNELNDAHSQTLWSRIVETVVLAIPTLSPKVHASYNKELKSLIQLLQSVERSRNSKE